MGAKSRMTPQWIAAALSQNPCVKLPNGNLRTCPVRLGFPNLFVPAPRQKKQPVPQPNARLVYSSTLLFPLGADISLLVNEVKAFALASKHTADAYNAQTGQFYGLEFPFRDQGEKANKYEGYIPGAYYINVQSEYKPQVVDARGNPIADPTKVYPGVWAFVALNLFSYNNLKKGVSFGLQNVMIVADDEPLGGGGTNPAEDFAGVVVDQATDFQAMMNSNPAMAGTAPAGQQFQTYQLPGQGNPFGGSPVGMPGATGSTGALMGGGQTATGYGAGGQAAPSPSPSDPMKSLLGF